jgi:hypothetical protein
MQLKQHQLKNYPRIFVNFLIEYQPKFFEFFVGVEKYWCQQTLNNEPEKKCLLDNLLNTENPRV